MWGYISLNYFKLNTQKNEVGSSTMPHKVNPIDFENAEGNLGIANALWRHFAEKLPVSRWQRDLSDSTVLRNLGMAFAYQLLAWQTLFAGLSKTIANYDEIARDLSSHWEVIAEAIQTVMRRYHLETPYEQLKQLTRGKSITQQDLAAFIHQLSIPESVKKELLQCRPDTYLGYARELAREI
jgi:adenylosuccinate lyase